MTTSLSSNATTPISPALLAAALNCLAYFPDGHRLEPVLLVAVTRTVTSDIQEADALLVRIRAAAIVLGDPRWPKWSAQFRAGTTDMQRTFDAVMLDCVATLPLDAGLQISPDDFFDALLARMSPATRN